MTSSARRAAWAGVAALLIAVTLWSMSGTESPPPPPTEAPGASTASSVGAGTTEALEDPNPQASALHTEHPETYESAPPEAPKKTRRYALGLHELRGLPETVSPGTTFELWATWEPPIVEEPYAGKLVPEVVVVDVIPPITPEGPTSVIVSIPLRFMSDFTYAHRWGTLSVALL